MQAVVSLEFLRHEKEGIAVISYNVLTNIQNFNFFLIYWWQMYFFHILCVVRSYHSSLSLQFLKVKTCDDLGLVFIRALAGINKVDRNALSHHCFDHFDEFFLFVFNLFLTKQR